jgi:hypothetical protein
LFASARLFGRSRPCNVQYVCKKQRNRTQTHTDTHMYKHASPHSTKTCIHSPEQVCIHMHAHAHACTRICTCIYARKHAHTEMHMHAYTHASTDGQSQTRVPTHVYAHALIHKHSTDTRKQFASFCFRRDRVSIFCLGSFMPTRVLQVLAKILLQMLLALGSVVRAGLSC